MKKSMPLLLIALLAACGKSETQAKTELPTVGALAANPERLKELRQQCKLERAELGDELSIASPKPRASGSTAMAR